MALGIRLSLILAAVLTDFAVDAGGGPTCPIWDRWYNSSHPGRQQDEYEPLPNQTFLDHFCPPQKGVIIVRCSSDPFRDPSFEGKLMSDDFEVTCNATDGLECLWMNGKCPDHAIQVGCDCDQVTIPSPSVLPPVCPTQGGSRITTPSTNNCSCPARGNQRQNTASLHAVAYRATLLAFTLCFLLK